ncbi:hypothetical protein [Nocardia sp. CNY236]|uniref:aromatic-ring hydroxylase C-terminal domain-containing protein n=1 Tax=Nocardia sp. CNY236 TaxID=1169152 RepID=UPI003510968A
MVLDTTLAQARRTETGPTVLVRPDGYIAWAGPSSRRTGPRGWETAWYGWIGPPTSRSGRRGKRNPTRDN